MAILAGSPAPEIPGVDLTQGPTVLFFFKVTCPVCQMAAPKVSTFERAYPGRIFGVGQDPAERLAEFSGEYGLTIPTSADLPPYPASDAYEVRVVPSTFLVSPRGTVLHSVESWDREGLNEMSRMLAEAIGAPFEPISVPEDGLPVFRPG